MVNGRTKEFLSTLLQSAHDLVNAAGGVGAIDGLDSEAHGKMMRSLYRQLRESHAVTQQTARRYIAKALRRERGYVMKDPAKMSEYMDKRGGARLGSGRKAVDKFAAWTTTDYDSVALYLITTAPSRKELDQRVDAYFQEPHQFERSSEQRGTMRQFEVALAKQQKYIFQLKNH